MIATINAVLTLGAESGERRGRQKCQLRQVKTTCLVVGQHKRPLYASAATRWQLYRFTQTGLPAIYLAAMKLTHSLTDTAGRQCH